jgi:hypothetical protein
MNRRAFIVLGGAVAAWPFGASGQQAGVQRIGAFIPGGSEAPVYAQVLREALNGLDWVEGKNIQVDYRWAQTECCRQGVQGSGPCFREEDRVTTFSEPILLQMLTAVCGTWQPH